jgi:LysM repeat protein
VKVITVKDTVYKTIRDTVVKVVTVKDTSSKIKLVEVSKTNSEVKKVTTKPVLFDYPKNKKFKINQVTAIWAEAGRSFLEIANTYSVPVYKLYQNNELVETDLVQKDQLLFLNEKKKVSDKKVHVSKDGETFYEIAQMEGIQLAALKSYNSSLTDDGIKEGTILYLFNMPKDPVVPANTEKVKAAVIEDKKAGESKPKKQNKFKIF